MGSFIFSLSEGLKGIKRAKLASFNAAGAISVSVLALGLFGFLLFMMQSLVLELETKIELEAFLADGLLEKQKNEIKNLIEAVEGVKSVEYISKEKALADFRQSFDLELKEVLGQNPLPASFRIKLSSEVFLQNRINSIAEQAGRINGVIEVVNNREVFSLLNKYRDAVIAVIMILGTALGITAVFLVTNSIKISVFSRRNVVELMRIVGARKSFIRRPFIFEGFLLGLTGGTAGILLFSGALKGFEILSGFNVDVPQEFLYGLVFTGIFLGLLGSVFSTAKIFRNIV